MEETILETHFNKIEEKLILNSNIASESGHSVNKGTAREQFIKEFLSEHLCENVKFGTGEIIDCNSNKIEKRNQIDIIIYKDNYPKIVLSKNIYCFLKESVISTIEVKSNLEKEKFLDTLKSIENTKKLLENITFKDKEHYIPPGFFSIIVAYDGPAKMETIWGWICEYMGKNNLTIPEMPPQKLERAKIASPIVDLIIVLGKGYIQFDNSILSPVDAWRERNPKGIWIISNDKTGNLLHLFLQLTFYIAHIPRNYLTISPYSEKILSKRKTHSLM